MSAELTADRARLLCFSTRAQQAAGLILDAAEWLELEQLTHTVAFSPLSGLATTADENSRAAWAALATGKPGPDFPPIFEQVIAALQSGKLKVKPADVPEELRYMIARALRVAHPWPERNMGGTS